MLVKICLLRDCPKALIRQKWLQEQGRVLGLGQQQPLTIVRPKTSCPNPSAPNSWQPLQNVSRKNWPKSLWTLLQIAGNKFHFAPMTLCFPECPTSTQYKIATSVKDLLQIWSRKVGGGQKRSGYVQNYVVHWYVPRC